MHKSATKCNETVGKWCKNKHGALKIIDTLETYQWIAKILPVGPNFHIVGIAALCWAISKTRNNACFEGRLISSPVGLLCYMCAFL
jgi:hypothetical protein